MAERKNYARIPLAAVAALSGEASADFEIRLPAQGEGEPALYRRSGAELDLPDYTSLREHGVTHLYVRPEDLGKCESILEGKLTLLLQRPELTPAEKAGVVHEVGLTVARDLTHAPDETPDLGRVANVVDNVIGNVLNDPQVVSQLLYMADHERTVASHMFMVSALAVLLGAEVFGSDPPLLRSFGFAGMLHDLGKLAIPSAILNKSGTLSAEEIHLIEQHPIESVRIIGSESRASPLARQMILQHHERVDGKGYPVGACGPNLPMPSRVIAVVDSFHAMIGRRPYRAPLTPVGANKVLNSLAGKQFDAEVLRCWNALFERCWSSFTPTAPQPADPPNHSPSLSHHEHRSAQPTRRTLHHRPLRSRCLHNATVRCLYAGRLPHASKAPDEFIAPVHDISRRGLCIYTAHPVYRGEVIHVQIGANLNKTWVRASVAWCRQLDAVTFRAGLRFAARIAESQARLPAAVEELNGPLRVGKNVGQPAPEVNSARPAPQDPRAADESMIANALKSLDTMTALRNLSPEDERAAILFSTCADKEVRLKSVAVLAKIASRSAREAIKSLLGDDDPSVRERAVATAGTLQMQEASFQLRKLLDDPVQAVALRSAGALGKLGDRAGLPVAVEALREGGELARLAAVAVGEIVGHRFASNAEGIRAALNYVEANETSRV